jgi:hypothetical protein
MAQEHDCEQHNCEIIKYRLVTVEDAVKELVRLSQGQSIVNSNLQESIKLQQQAYNEFHDRYIREERPKLNSLWDNQSKVKGGYATIGVICSIALGLVAIIRTIWH